jgi:hypothetical protein
MRHQIPKEILDRCEFRSTKADSTEYLVRIKPIAPCECGAELDDTRRTRIQRTVEPKPHWREYCYTCKLVSVLGEGNWQSAKELNAKMRKLEYWQDK